MFVIRAAAGGARRAHAGGACVGLVLLREGQAGAPSKRTKKRISRKAPFIARAMRAECLCISHSPNPAGAGGGGCRCHVSCPSQPASPLGPRLPGARRPKPLPPCILLTERHTRTRAPNQAAPRGRVNLHIFCGGGSLPPLEVMRRYGMEPDVAAELNGDGQDTRLRRKRGSGIHAPKRLGILISRPHKTQRVPVSVHGPRGPTRPESNPFSPKC